MLKFNGLIEDYINTAILRMHQELFQEVHLERSEISSLLSDALWPPGKAVRPRLALTIGFLFSQNPLQQSGMMTLCKAIECLHIASLLHDDVLDSGITRRYRSCFYRTWGTRRAILLGDYLLSIALKYLVESNHSGLLPVIQHAITQMTVGQIQEETMSWSQGIAEYEEIAHQKTASLFAATAKAVCTLFHVQDSRGVLLESYGKVVGFCFQIQDDLQDYIGTKRDKKRFQDFFQSRITAPLLWLREKISLEEQSQVKAWWTHPTPEHASFLCALMVKYGIPCYGQEKIQEHKRDMYYQLQTYWSLDVIEPLMKFFTSPNSISRPQE